MKHYLVRLNGAWIDVRGDEQLRCLGEGIGFVPALQWHDRRGGLSASGVALPHEFISHYPRALSDKERGIGIKKEVIE